MPVALAALAALLVAGPALAQEDLPPPPPSIDSGSAPAPRRHAKKAKKKKKKAKRAAPADEAAPLPDEDKAEEREEERDEKREATPPAPPPAPPAAGDAAPPPDDAHGAPTPKQGSGDLRDTGDDTGGDTGDEDAPRPAPPPKRGRAGEDESDGDDSGARRARGEDDDEDAPGVKRRGFGIERVGPVAADLLVAPIWMGFPTGFETHFDLGLAATCDIGDVGFTELRYQHASTSLAEGAVDTATGYHTLSTSVGLGAPVGPTFLYGLLGLSWEITNVSYTFANEASGSDSNWGSHFGALFGGGARMRVPLGPVPVEARMELDWKRRGQFNDFVLGVMLGAAYDWHEE